MDVQEYCKTNRGSSQIPAFGNWEYVNDLPITQYFECARQAGLMRYSSSSGECDPHTAADSAVTDLYSVAADNYAPKPRANAPARSKQGKGRDKKGGMAQKNYNVNNNKEGNMNMNSRKQGAGKVFNVTATELPPASAGGKRQSESQAHQPRRPPKAVDEDLYKIPPELLKRKRRLGFISRCLVPPCAV